jgi:hypothetical protein
MTTSAILDVVTWVTFGVMAVALFINLGKEWLKTMAYKGYRLEDAHGNVLPDSERSCERCATSQCECLYPLMARLKRGKKGQRVVGIRVEDDKSVPLAFNTVDYVPEAARPKEPVQ